MYVKNNVKSTVLFKYDWCIFVRVSNDLQTEMIVGFVYFTPGSEIREHIELLMGIIRDLKGKYTRDVIVVGGDFNCRVGSYGSVDDQALSQSAFVYSERNSMDQVTDANGKYLLDVMGQDGMLLLNGRVRGDLKGNFTHISSRGNSVIDLVWFSLSDVSTVRSLCVDDGLLTSDHLPCFVEIGASSSVGNVGLQVKTRTSSRHIVKIPADSVLTFRRIASQSGGLRLAVEDVDSCYDNFHKSLVAVLTFLNMYKEVRCAENTVGRGQPWYDGDCRAQKRIVRASFRTCKKYGFSDPHLSGFLSEKRKYKKLIKVKKQAHTQLVSILLRNVNSPTQFWSAFRSLVGRKSCDCPIPWPTWRKHYERFYSEFLVLPKLDFFDAQHPYLDQMITRHELSRIINRAGTGKAPGLDCFTNEVYKALPPDWFNYVLIMFNKIFDKECIPQEWGLLRVVHLHKKGSTLSVDNYRNLALLNCITKIFTSILCSRLSVFAESCNLLPEAQAGFRRGRSCTDNLFVLHTVVNNSLRLKGRKIYALFVDFHRAFDTVEHCLLWETLFDLGVSAKFIRILKDLYSKACIRGDDNVNVKITKGVLQGDPLSPLLFALFIADLETYFRRRGAFGVPLDAGENVLSLMYADDLVIFADSPSALRKNLSTLNEYCNSKRLEVNVDKTKIVVFRRGVRIKSEQYYYGNQLIEIVNSYIYLGVLFKYNNSFHDQLENQSARVGGASGMLRNALARGKISNLNIVSNLYSSVVLPTFTYGMEVWGLNYCHRLEKVQSDFFKGQFYLRRNTPHYLIRREFSLRSVEFCLLKQVLFFINRTMNLSALRLTRRALLRDFHLSAGGSGTDYSWSSRFKCLMFDQLNIEDFDINSFSSENIKLILGRCEQAGYDRDWDGVLLSVSCPLYKFLGVPGGFTDFYRSDLDINVMRLFAQLRMSSDSQVKLYVNYKSYTIDLTKRCQICNRGELESLQHMLFECPHYRRTAAFSRLGTDLHAILSARVHTDIMSIYYFIKNAMRVRDFLLDE